MFRFKSLRKFLLDSLNLIRLELFFMMAYSFYLRSFYKYFTNLIFNEGVFIGFTFFLAVIFFSSFFVSTIKKNARTVSNILFLFCISLIIYTTYINRFNLESFCLFIFCFIIFSFALSSIKWFLRVNTILFIEIFAALICLDFNIEISYALFIPSLLLILLSGFCITLTRNNYKNKVRISESKYWELTDQSIFGVFIIKNNRIVFVNNRAIKILNYKNTEDLIGLHRENVILLDNLENLRTTAEEIKKGSSRTMREYKLINYKKENIDVELKPALIDFEGEECIICSFIDISNRKKIKVAKEKVKKAINEKDALAIQLEENRQIQRKLQNSQSYSEGIIESSLDMIFTTNIKGKITKLNSAAKNQLKLTESDFNNKSFDLILKDKSLKKKILEQLNRKNSFSGKVELLRKDNSYFSAFLSISHLYTTKGNFLGIMGVSRDISDVMAKEQEIKEQSSKLNAIIESSSHYFFSVNKNHRLTSFNKLFLNEQKEKFNIHLELMDDFFTLFKEDEIELKEFWKNKFNIVFKGGSTEFEISRKLVDGKLNFREIFLNPIYGDDGKIEEVSGIGHDITDKKLYELELKKSIEEKEVLLKEVHHRVKNNLQVISSILNLQSTKIKDKSMLLALKDSQDRIRSMATIHERLYRTKNFSSLNLSEYVQDLSESILSSYELSNISVELVFSLDEIFISLNTAIPCGLIINELITNSLKYAFNERNKGTIRINLQKFKEEIVLVISDDGIGIQDLKNIKNTDTLGITLVTTLVEQIEGEIKIENESGTTFTIKFKPELKE